MENNIRTSEEYAQLFIEEYFYPDIQAKGEGEESDEMKSFVLNWIKAYVIPDRIEFAKLHVQAALKEAGEKAKINGYWYNGEFIQNKPINVNKDSILNAYPLDQIK